MNIQSINTNTAPYSDFPGYNKNPLFIMEKLPEKPERKQNTVGISIGITALALGLVVLGFNRFSLKKIVSPLEKLKKYFENKWFKNLKTKPHSEKDKTYAAQINKISRLISKSESVNNFTSIKDSLFKKLMDKTKLTRKIHSGITKMFNAASRATVTTSWANTVDKFNKMFKNLDKFDEKILKTQSGKIIEINGTKKSAEEWVKILKTDKDILNSKLKLNTSRDSIKMREAYMLKSVNGVDKVVLENIKDIKNPKIYNSFIADRYITPSKETLYSQLMDFRKEVSYTPAHKRKIVMQILKKAEKTLPPECTEEQYFILKLKQMINKNASEKEIAKYIESFKQTAKEAVSGSKTVIPQEFTEYLNKAGTVIQSTYNGKVEEILSLYKHLAPEDYSKISKQFGSAVQSLDRSINLEGIQYFEKLRDLQAGSAPTDVLSILASGGYIAYALSGSDNKDEKISILLKNGIPVLAAIATSLFCTARLISGGKALATGLLSGFIVNKVGNFADDLRHKYSQTKTQEATPKTV